MESYPLLNHDAIVHIALFANLANAAALRARLVAASQLSVEEGGDQERARLNFAFIEAGMVISRLHLLTAVSQALVAHAADKLKTITLHSEILFELDPGSNIIDSLKNFGLSPNTTSVIIVRVTELDDKMGKRGRGAEAAEEKMVFEAMQATVQGTLAPLDDLGAMTLCNRKAIRKVYKLNTEAALAKVVAGSQEERSVLEGLCSSAVAVKTVGA